MMMMMMMVHGKQSVAHILVVHWRIMRCKNLTFTPWNRYWANFEWQEFVPPFSDYNVSSLQPTLVFLINPRPFLLMQTKNQCFTCLWHLHVYFLNHKLRVSDILLNLSISEHIFCQSKRTCIIIFFISFFLLGWSFFMTLILATFRTDTSSSTVPYASNTFRWF